jgi:6-phosphogluconolactonase
MKIKIFNNLNDLSLAAARIFLKSFKDMKDYPFTVALSGGSTPKNLYKLISSEPFASSISWDDLVVFFTDERCVERGSSESNYQMTYEHLLSLVRVPGANVHPIPLPTGDMDSRASASIYEREIREFFSLTKSEDIPSLDMVLLGLGADGHTLSLFPESEALNACMNNTSSVLVMRSRAGDTAALSTHERITMTPTLVNNAKTVIFLVSGKNKAKAVRDTIEGEREPLKHPARLIAPANGELIWLLDKDAASLLHA